MTNTEELTSVWPQMVAGAWLSPGWGQSREGCLPCGGSCPELLRAAVKGFTANCQKSQLNRLIEQEGFLGNAVQPIQKGIRWLSLRGTSLSVNCRKSPDDWFKLDTQLSHSWHQMGCILATLPVTKLQTLVWCLMSLCVLAWCHFLAETSPGKNMAACFPSQCKSGGTHGVQCCVTQLFTFLGFRFRYCCSQWNCSSAEKY